MEHSSATKRNILQMHQHSNVIKKCYSKWKGLSRDNHILYNSIFILVKENCSDRMEIRHPGKDVERRLIAKELKWAFLVIDMPFHNFGSDYMATWLSKCISIYAQYCWILLVVKQELSKVARKNSRK